MYGLLTGREQLRPVPDAWLTCCCLNCVRWQRLHCLRADLLRLVLGRVWQPVLSMGLGHGSLTIRLACLDGCLLWTCRASIRLTEVLFLHVLIMRLSCSMLHVTSGQYTNLAVLGARYGVLCGAACPGRQDEPCRDVQTN